MGKRKAESTETTTTKPSILSTSLLKAADKSENDLEAFLFGDASSIHEEKIHLKDNQLAAEEDLSLAQDDTLFFTDKVPSALNAVHEESEDELTEVHSPPPLAAWKDDDDDSPHVNLVARDITRKLRRSETENEVSGKQLETRLRQQFQRLHPKPKWAEALQQDFVGDDAEDSLFLRNDKSLLHRGPAQTLLPDKIDVSRLRDANYQSYNESVVQCLEWHPKANVLLTAGMDKTVRLFQIDGRENTKIQSVFFKDLPILCAQFTPSGTEVILTGPRKHFYSYDLEGGSVRKIPYIVGREEAAWKSFNISPCGTYMAMHGANGEIVLVSTQTKQYVGVLSMNAEVHSTTFSADGHSLYSAGADGEVYLWDMRNQRHCVHRFRDEGSLKLTSMDISPTSTFFATGSQNGVVNVYDAKSCLQSAQPRPQKAVMSLTTFVSQVKFNHDGQVLGICSRTKKDQLRLVHLPSCRVFANWPTAQTPLGYVQCFGFSPRSHYLAVGNAKGKVLLYQLNHYLQ